MLKLLVTIMMMLIPSIAFSDSRLDNCLQYKDEIESILESEGISSDYFYLAVCESGCKIKTSPKGARGFFQVMPPTYRHYKSDDCSEDDIDDIRCNTIAAARYIKHLQEQFKNFYILIKAYNRGGTNYKRFGTTPEADGLSNCVRTQIKNSKQG